MRTRGQTFGLGLLVGALVWAGTEFFGGCAWCRPLPASVSAKLPPCQAPAALMMEGHYYQGPWWVEPIPGTDRTRVRVDTRWAR